MLLETHSLTHLVALDGSDISPGSLVCHVNDTLSCGLCVSRRLADIGCPMVCDVMWSRDPFGHNYADRVAQLANGDMISTKTAREMLGV